MNMDNSVKYELPVQTEIPAVISVPRAEMYSNALDGIGYGCYS